MKFLTYYQGIAYECQAHGYYYAFLDLARQIAENIGYVPPELEIEGKHGLKIIKIEMT